MFGAFALVYASKTGGAQPHCIPPSNSPLPVRVVAYAYDFSIYQQYGGSFVAYRDACLISRVLREQARQPIHVDRRCYQVLSQACLILQSAASASEYGFVSSPRDLVRSMAALVVYICALQLGRSRYQTEPPSSLARYKMYHMTA